MVQVLSTQVTFEEFYNSWDTSDLSRGTLYRSRFGMDIAMNYYPENIQDTGVEHMLALQEALEEQGLPDHEIFAIQLGTRHFFRWAYVKGYLKQNPMAMIPLIRVEHMPTKLALAEFMLSREERDRSPDTLHVYRYALTPTLTFYPHFIDEVRSYHIDAYIQSLYARGLSISTIVTYYRHNDVWFNWIVGRGYMPQSPMKNVEKPKSTKKKKLKAIEPENAQRMIATCEITASGLQDLCILIMLSCLGLRAGGITNLRVQDVDFEGGILYLKEKTGFREMPLDSTIASLIALHIMVRGEHETDAMFLGLDGESPLTYDGLYDMLERRAKLAGVPKPYSPHAFRHMFGKQFVILGGSLSSLSGLMGHGGIKITHEFYLRFRMQEKKDIFGKHSPLKMFLKLLAEKMAQLKNLLLKEQKDESSDDVEEQEQEEAADATDEPKDA